ncbi:uncharacterized protein LOC121091247 isoform X1 [Falco naumanni]|uniref:uncharacterized protein LOC121091247 isoform X1 n=1 Tax=Falco naumanni TaxID=148594 RepID=UPI001ADE3A7F|nr:uncharacterized protein LOC121091247 isoform X1 [Falco naumanni]
MGLRLPLRRSASFTPGHPALAEPPGPAALRAEANVLVMGADSVGKSALTVRFLTRRFIGEYGDMEFIYSHNLTVDGREILFHIWDVPNSQPPSNCSRSPCASTVQTVPGKKQTRGSFPGQGSHRAPSQAAPSVRLPVPGEERRWGRGCRARSRTLLLLLGSFSLPLPKPSPLYAWERACVCSTDTDFSAVFFWKCNKLYLAGGPQLLGAVNLYLGHGKRHVLCWARVPTVAAAATQRCVSRTCSLSPGLGDSPHSAPSFWWLALIKQLSRAAREGLLLQQIQQGVVGSEAVLRERGAPGAPPVLTGLPDPTIHPATSWVWVPRGLSYPCVLLVRGDLWLLHRRTFCGQGWALPLGN